MKTLLSKEQKKEIKINKKAIYNFCADHYYSDHDRKTYWEPFEHYNQDQIDEYINNDIYVLIAFLKSDNIKIN